MVERIERYRLGSGSVSPDKSHLKHPEKSHPGNASGKRGGNGAGGRILGRPNKQSREMRERAAASGELPHEFMLRVMRMGPGGVIGEGEHAHTLAWEDIQWAAMGCANYYASKLSSINVNGVKTAPTYIMHVDPGVLKNCSVDELMVLEKVFSRLEAGGDEADDFAMIDAAPYAETLQ